MPCNWLKQQLWSKSRKIKLAVQVLFFPSQSRVSCLASTNLETKEHSSCKAKQNATMICVAKVGLPRKCNVQETVIMLKSDFGVKTYVSLLDNPWDQLLWILKSVLCTDPSPTTSASDRLIHHVTTRLAKRGGILYSSLLLCRRSSW